MANVLIHGYKVKMRIDHALFYYFFGERTVPKNINEWEHFIGFTGLWAMASAFFWLLSYIPGFGIEMMIAVFIAAVYLLLYKPVGDLGRPILFAGLACYLYINKANFMLTMFGYHLEPYYLQLVMGLCALNLLYRIYNRLIWFFNDRIIKRYKLPVPDQGALQQAYFNRNYVEKRAYKKSLTAFRDFEQAKAFESSHSEQME